MIGLAKVSIVGFEVRSLFFNGNKLPSENMKLVSRGLVSLRKCGGGGKSSSFSSNSLLSDLRGSV